MQKSLLQQAPRGGHVPCPLQKGGALLVLSFAVSPSLLLYLCLSLCSAYYSYSLWNIPNALPCFSYRLALWVLRNTCTQHLHRNNQVLSLFLTEPNIPDPFKHCCLGVAFIRPLVPPIYTLPSPTSPGFPDDFRQRPLFWLSPHYPPLVNIYSSFNLNSILSPLGQPFSDFATLVPSPITYFEGTL